DLYSCLFINKLWCENVIPIIWADPFKFNKRLSFYNLIISFFSPETENLLISKGIDVFQNPFTTTSYKPIFNYIRFLKTLDTFHISNMVQTLLEANSHIVVNDENRYLLGEEIYKLILDQCLNL